MPSNPIALRLKVLAAQWPTFASNDLARLLRWRCLRVPAVETFVARENEPDGRADLSLRSGHAAPSGMLELALPLVAKRCETQAIELGKRPAWREAAAP